MRGFEVEGRFSVDYERLSMKEGMTGDLGNKVGQKVNWFRWQDWYLAENFGTIADDIYDVSSSAGGEGRRWMLPFKLPVLMAQITRGGNQMNERGFYIVDTMRLVINAGEAERLLPSLVGNEPTDFIRDRIEYRGQVFVPIRVNPRGALGNQWSVISVDCTEVNSEELVNDPQFAKYASSTPIDYRSQ
jgi:hypothetical protein